MPDRADRRFRIAEGIVLLAVAALAAVLFEATTLDLAAARLFYHAGEADAWPTAHRLPWSVLYGAAPWITALLVVAGLVTLAGGAALGRDALRQHGVFLLLSVVLGPGLLVNFIFKDHWGRPRPRDIVEFAGTSSYVPPLVPCREGGSSFPCGHCSVGFLCGVGWWICRRPVWAWTSLAAGGVAGFALGLGRMAAGGHFLSDVVWSAILALGIAHVLYYHVLRIPAREQADARAVRATTRSARFQRLLAVCAALGGIAVLVALFVTPHGTSLARRIPLAPASRPVAFEFTARVAHVDLVLVDTGSEISIEGEIHGFGLPTSRLTTEVETTDSGVPAVRFRIVQHGWFTDLDASASVRIPVEGLERVSVRVDRGNIRVIDRTRAGVAASGRPLLDLHTGYGRVISVPRPAPSR